MSRRTSEPHTPPEATGHWHFPPSRFTTSRFTFTATEDLRFSCCAMSSSSATFSACSSVAPGCTCDCPALAFFSNARNSRDTVMCIRLSLEVSGSTTVFTSPGVGFAPSGWVRSSSTGWTVAGAASTGPRSGTSVTIVLLGTSAAGWISASTCFASCFEQWKNFGITSARFSLVITLASSMALVMQSRPSRTGSTTSGNLWTSRAAT
jgi:hypothetical protein